MARKIDVMNLSKTIFGMLMILFISIPAFAQNGIDKPRYQILTKRAGAFLGTFDIELFPLIAPLHVQNFDSLVNDQFFDSTAFHRVVPGFVIQGGDPNSINGPISTWGQGQPWQVTVPAEFSAVRHLRGILGAARDTDPNSASSQFYICVANSTFLDGNYTVYGKVTSGMNIVDTIVASPRDANDVPLQKIEMFVTYIGVNDSIPDAPVLNVPADGATGVLNTQNFSWSAVNSAVMYTVEFSTDPTFATLAFSVNAGNVSLITTALQGNTVYYWRVKSNNGGHESAYSSIRTFTTATGNANLVYPPDLSTGIAVNPVFVWDPVPGADSYTLQVSTSATFTTQSMVYNTAGLTGTSQQVNGLNPNSVYYWRVRSALGTTQGFYSAKFSFTTGTSTWVTDNDLISGISVSPVPAKDHITVSGYMKKSSEVELAIHSIDGKQLNAETHPLKQGVFALPLDTTGLPSGIYFVTIQSEGHESVLRIAVY
jgi:peptidyl-prolyl cis-trans isomerase B (cyclophilin B)